MTTAPKEHPRIILASGSPRRKDLLEGLGLNFEIIPADLDEDSFSATSPAELVATLSLEKARAVASQHSSALIIAADTIVVLDDDILGKPKDLAENKQFIRRLANRSHSVFTGHTLMFKGQEETHVEEAKVFFRDLSDDELERFVATGDGLDKAGGYGIQGYGSTLVPRIEGDYFTIVGLSIVSVVHLAKRLGVTLV